MSIDVSAKLDVNFNQTIYTNHPDLAPLEPLFKCEAVRKFAISNSMQRNDALSILIDLVQRFSKIDSSETLLSSGKSNRFLFLLAEQEAKSETTQAKLQEYSFQKSTWGQSIWYVTSYWMYLFMSDPTQIDCSDSLKLGREEYVACEIAQKYFAEKLAESLTEACTNLEAKTPYPAEYTKSLGSMFKAAYDQKMSYSRLNTKHLESDWTNSIKPTFCQESTSHPLNSYYCDEANMPPTPKNASDWINNYARNAFLPQKVMSEVLVSQHDAQKDEL